MTHNYLFKFTICILLVNLITLKNPIAAQPGSDANKHPQPYMWSKDDQQFVINFKNTKYNKLNRLPGVTQPYSFLLGNFLGLIKYFSKKYENDFECLHVYIALFSQEGSAGVPKGAGNLLTLIFAPATSYDNPKGQRELNYFIIPPNDSFDESGIARFEISNTEFQEWTDNYKDNLLDYLLPTLNTNDSDNYDETTKKYSDTKHIIYCAGSILELVNEQSYIHQKNKKLINLSTDMQAAFGAFDYNGNTRFKGHNKKRLFVLFDFIDSDSKNKVLLEDTDGFKDRSPFVSQCGNCVPTSVTDNGQLCPTVCN